LQGDWSSDVCSSDLVHQPVRLVDRFLLSVVSEFDHQPPMTLRQHWEILPVRPTFFLYVVHEPLVESFQRDRLELEDLHEVSGGRSEERRVGKECRSW